MSDTSDFKKLDLDEPTADEEGGSFATWLPPMLSMDPTPARPPVTLTGLGPPSGPRVSVPVEPDDADIGWDDGAEGTLAEPKTDEPLYTEPSDIDEDDDEPTRVISQMLPNLKPKIRALGTPGDRTGAEAATARSEERAPSQADEVISNGVTDPAPHSVSDDAAPASAAPHDDVLAEAALESGSIDPITQAGQASVTSVAAPADQPEPSWDDVTIARAVEQPPGESREALAQAPAQESELLSLMAESLSKRRSSPVRYSVAPVVRETETQEAPLASVEIVQAMPSLAPPEVPTTNEAGASGTPAAVYPPAQYERELPTSPSSRRPTPAAPIDVSRPRRTTPARGEPPWAATVRPRVLPAPRVALRYAIFAFAASALVTVLVLRALLPGKGTLLVTAVGSSGMPVENAQVLVDGVFACSPVPCRVTKVREGRRLVTVKAGGYQPIADRAVNVESDNEALVHFSMAPENTAGIHVRVEGRGLRVFLDGEDRGEAPLTLGGLAPTEHTIRLAGSPLYAAFEQKITLRPNSTMTFSPNLVALQAFISITAGSGAESATVEVIGGPQRKAVVELPARIEVPPLGTYRIRATRRGYHDFETSIQFGNGEAEKRVRIDLVPVTAPAIAHALTKPAANTVPVVLEETMPVPPKAIAPTPGGTGSLSVNSVPPSNVIVDGRPVGATPQRLALPPGNHSVVFVHPAHGRKTLNVRVEPGKTAVASARF